MLHDSVNLRRFCDSYTAESKNSTKVLILRWLCQVRDNSSTNPFHCKLKRGNISFLFLSCLLQRVPFEESPTLDRINMQLIRSDRHVLLQIKEYSYCSIKWYFKEIL